MDGEEDGDDGALSNYIIVRSKYSESQIEAALASITREGDQYSESEINAAVKVLKAGDAPRV